MRDGLTGAFGLSAGFELSMPGLSFSLSEVCTCEVEDGPSGVRPRYRESTVVDRRIFWRAMSCGSGSVAVKSGRWRRVDVAEAI